MPSATSALYEPLIGRDLDAIPAAARAYRERHSSDELFLAVARFAVLAYAPSQHAKHALLACLSAWELRDELGERFDELLIECARYAASSRLPWSEPPILEPPEPAERGGVDELRAAVQEGDRLRGERWLARRIDDDGFARDVFLVATDDSDPSKLLAAHACWKLAAILGEKGRYAVWRAAVWDLTASRGTPPDERGVDGDALTHLLARCIAERGSIESAHAVFLYEAARETGMLDRLPKIAAHDAAPVAPASRPELPVYRLARDYGQTLRAHALRLEHPLNDAFLAAVHQNLAEGEDFEEWSFA